VRTILATLATAGILLHASAASASPNGRVAILGPERSAIVTRLQRNFAEKPADLSTAVVSSCPRVTVASALAELDAETAICTDGDVVSVWKMENGYVQLVDAVPIVHGDDRSIEVIAARITIAARSGKTSNESGSTTIIANGDEHTDTAQIIRDATAATTTTLTPPAVDKPVPVPNLSVAERVAPRALVGLGPMLLASKSGGSFAMSLEAEFGVSRVVTFIPWIATIPAARGVETPNGSASYRPTLFGVGFGVPLRSWKKTLVPRLGAGYALIWMHTWPGQAKNGTTVGESEDLWAPAMYGTAALSVGITNNVRIVGEGMIGSATNNLIVRIARAHTDSWGVPIASLGVRAELVLP
jgi:hypothetical protein